MKLNAKNYKTIKTKNYFRTNNLILLFNGLNTNQKDWVVTEQNLNEMQFKYYKTFNKIAVKTLEKSTISVLTKTIHGVTLFIKPDNVKEDLPANILKKFEPLSFILISFKLNNKIYSINQVKKMQSLNYRKNKLLFYQFGIANLKRFKNISK